MIRKQTLTVLFCFALLLCVIIWFVIRQPDTSTVTNDNLEYRQAEMPQNAKLISAGTWHTIAVMEDTSLWAWGTVSNYGGSLGNGTENNSLLPVRILDNVVHAIAGETHSLAITSDGVLWAWGNNTAGQLGDGTTERRLSPVKIMKNVVYATIAPAFSSAQVSCSARSFAITEDGTLWAWGGNRYLPTKIMENVISITPSYSGAFAITKCNTLWGWGGNSDGIFGDIDVVNQLTPTPIMENVANVTVYHKGSTAAISTDGTLWILGSPHFRFMDNVAHAHGALDYAFFVLTADGNLYACGYPSLLYDRDWRDTPTIPLLGDGTTEDRNSPVRIMDNVASFSITADAAFAITKDDTLWAWGTNLGGELGDGTKGIPRLSPIPILENVVSISSSYRNDHGATHFINTFAITRDGSIWAWGSDDRGFSTLGDGTHDAHSLPVRIIASE